jgi:phosphoenolpyruvate-protein phosphotransferase (PTS system enzyme I)
VPAHDQRGEKVFPGIPVSAGVCRGRVLVLDLRRGSVPERTLNEDEVADEVQRLEQALIRTRQGIQVVQEKVSQNMGSGDAGIFDAHLLMLEDPSLLDEVFRLIQEEKCNAERAVHQASEKYAAALEASGDDYLRERSADLRDVAGRLLGQLMGRTEEEAVRQLKEQTVIIAHDLTPSITAQLDKKHVLGFGTDVGSKTSHSAILARSLGLPAVAGLKDASEHLRTGDYVLLDGFNGVVILNPTDQTLFEYGEVVRRRVDLEASLAGLKDKPAVTLDGIRITLSANIEHPDDIENVLLTGAEGVGLFRTEYLFINREKLPDEQEQFEAYHRVAAALKPHPVVIRTLDLGGDKFLSSLGVPREMNPFLGWRAIRYCLQQPDLFRGQLRAILRASVEGNVKMMFPMVCAVDEVLQSVELVERCRQELRAEGVAFDEAMEIGIMIEVPSAAVIADLLARHVKFFSLGTNDLVQYSLAVDRLNERIAHLYEPTHPGILRLINTTVTAARTNGSIWVGVCGEMAGDPVLVPLLLGLGVDELSVAPPLVPHVKRLIRRLRISEARELAAFALEQESGAPILERCKTLARRLAPELFDPPPERPPS